MKSLKSRAISFCFMSLAWSTAAAESSFTPLGTGTGCIDGQSNPYGHSEALGVSAASLLAMAFWKGKGLMNKSRLENVA